MQALTQSNTQYNYTQAQNRVGGYGVNGLNQYTQIDGEALQHNANGNLTQDRAPDGQLIQYTYDMENHLVAAAGPVASTLTYDTLGRLSRLTLPNGTTQFLYDGDALVAEYLDGTLTRRYVHGDQVDEPLVQYTGTNLATRRYLHADHQGSVIAHSDGTGAATQKNAYDPYGIPASSNSGRFGYTGQTWIPELGLNYYKARIYSPRLGRFLQTDPIFYEDDMNMYAYVGSDPLNTRDPTGNAVQFVLPVIVVISGGAVSACTIACTAKGEGAEIFASNYERWAGRLAFSLLMLSSPTALSHWVLSENSNESEDEESKSGSDDRNPADDQKLTPGEIGKLQGKGMDPEELKGGKATGKLDLFKDKKGNIFVKPKDGSGPGDPTGININNL